MITLYELFNSAVLKIVIEDSSNKKEITSGLWSGLLHKRMTDENYSRRSLWQDQNIWYKL